MSEEESCYYHIFLLRQDQMLQNAGMTQEWLALALTNEEKKVRVRVNFEIPCGILATLVPLVLYYHLSGLLDFDEDEARAMMEEEESDDDVELEETDEDFYQNLYVNTLARLGDGRTVEIVIPFCELEGFVDGRDQHCRTGETIEIDYRTRFDLGQNVIFTNLWVPLEVATELGVVPEICFELS